jgi:hypothetical protein
MVAGFDSKDTTAEPNSFFAYFVDEPELQVRTGFVGLQAPSLVKTASMHFLRALDHVRESYGSVKNLDIGDWAGVDSARRLRIARRWCGRRRRIRGQISRRRARQGCFPLRHEL